MRVEDLSNEELMDEFLNRFGISGFMKIKDLLDSNDSYRNQIDVLLKKLEEREVEKGLK